MATIPIVNTQDKRIGLISSVAALVLLLVIMWMVQYEIADPPPPDLHLEASEPLDHTIIKDITVDVGGGGGGNPSKDPKRDPQVTENMITQENSNVTVNDGNANSTTTPNSPNPPSGDNIDNPFAGGTGGGTGGGQGTGNGTGIGSDDGPKGSGHSGGGGTRSLLSEVHANDIHYNHDVIFVFNVSINADGVVIYVENVKSKTTTSDEVIIRKVIALVKKQVRYSKSPGASVQTMRYTVNFKAT